MTKQQALERMGSLLASLASAPEEGVDWEAVAEVFGWLSPVDKGAHARTMADAVYAKTKITKGNDATTKTTTHTDPEDGFTRTALVIDSAPVGSIDVLNRDGVRIAQINICYSNNAEGEILIVDTIDVKCRFADKQAFSFSPTERVRLIVPNGGNLVSADFRNTPRKAPSK